MRVTYPLFFLALIASSAAWAGPTPVICIRDMKQDPTLIRAMFDKVDRLAVWELSNSRVYFHLEDRGFIPINDFVLHSNFRDGREDSAPLKVTGIRRLQFAGEPRDDALYVVGTKRSAWFDRGSDANSSFTEVNNTWLVGFSGCHINNVREVPELHYLQEGHKNG